MTYALTMKEKVVVDTMNTVTATHVDDIAAKTQMTISEVLSKITILELKGLVRQMQGKSFILAA